jgi:uncharacterized metal-binding protein
MRLFLRRLRSCFWLPYGLCFRHRTTLSHFPIIGTATRVLYGGVPLLLVAWRLGVDFAAIPGWIELGVIAVIIGVAIADAAHAVADCWQHGLRRAIVVAGLVGAVLWWLR